MNHWLAIMKIADIHVERITMAMQGLQELLPLDAKKISQWQTHELLLAEMLIGRFGKLQDYMGHTIINVFLMRIEEYNDQSSMLDKLHQLQRLAVIEDIEVWRDMRRIRHQMTHEYPDHPEIMAVGLNQLMACVPILLGVLDKIKAKAGRAYP